MPAFLQLVFGRWEEKPAIKIPGKRAGNAWLIFLVMWSLDKKIIATAGCEDSQPSTSTFLKKETFENDSHMDGLDVQCIM